jgi:hypothetical protein
VSISEGNKTLADLKIPEHYRSGVALLATMSNEAFDALLKAIKSGLTADNASDLVPDLGEKSEVLRKQSKLSEIIAATTSMQGIFYRSIATPEQFAQDVTEALADDAPDLAKKTDSKILSARIVKLVLGKKIDITDQKIRSLQLEVERSFCCVRILTDVRAAFTADPTIAPTGMTILNTLRIGYIDDQGEHREFYLAMDRDDLSNLKKTIDRAQKKSKTLESLLAKANCHLFE